MSSLFWNRLLETVLRPFLTILRNGQSTVGGPNRTKMDLFGQNGPNFTKMDHFGLANAKIQFGIRAYCQERKRHINVNNFSGDSPGG